jgi:hypothetical protein
MTTIYDGPDVEVRYLPAESNFLCITFSHLYGSYQNKMPGFAEAFLIKRQISALHFIARSNHWWQPEDVDQALDSVMNSGVLDQYAERVGYGSSMGAYGAILFSRNLKLTRVAAMSPQFSVDPLVVPWDERYKPWTSKLAFRRPALNVAVDKSTDVLVVYDPHTLDKQHWRHLSVIPNATPLQLPYCGHPPLAFLESVGLIGKFTLEAIEGSLDPSEWRQIRRAERRKSQHYWLRIATTALALKRLRLAIDACESCLSINPTNDEAWCIKGRAHQASGHFERAQEAFAMAVKLKPAQSSYQVLLQRSHAANSPAPQDV